MRAAAPDPLEDALLDAESVCRSVSMSIDRRVMRDRCTMFLQTQEWCEWLTTEVLPKLETTKVAYAAYKAGSEEAFGAVVEQKKAAEARAAQLQETILAQQRVIGDMLTAMRRAVLALAFAAETSPAMRDDYNALSAAIARTTGAMP